MDIKQKNELARRIVLGVSTLGLAASVIGGIHQNHVIKEADIALHKHPSYVQRDRFGRISGDLNKAEKNLRYSPTYFIYFPGLPTPNTFYIENYPDPKDARNRLVSALKDLGDEGNLDDRLKLVYDTLPDRNDMKVYHCKEVDNSTFAKQRAEINDVKKI